MRVALQAMLHVGAFGLGVTAQCREMSEQPFFGMDSRLLFSCNTIELCGIFPVQVLCDQPVSSMESLADVAVV